MLHNHSIRIFLRLLLPFEILSGKLDNWGVGGGDRGTYSYTRVLHDLFLFKSMMVCEHEYMNTAFPQLLSLLRHWKSFP